MFIKLKNISIFAKWSIVYRMDRMFENGKQNCKMVEKCKLKKNNWFKICKIFKILLQKIEIFENN